MRKLVTRECRFTIVWVNVEQGEGRGDVKD